MMTTFIPPKGPKILFYDIETTYLMARVWRCGEQIIRHDQLVDKYSRYDIICITYCYNDGKPAQVLHWGYQKQDSKKMLAKFDQLIQEADIVIGKNSDKFDNKHLNMHRMFNQMPGMPNWELYTDDLEKQFRKHFGQALPSHSLDYISQQLGLGGKMKMEFQDWIDIVEQTKDGPEKFKKMLDYGKKDVEDTRAIWHFAEEHLSPKYLKPTTNKVCSKCGSHRLHKRGYRVTTGGEVMQRWFCMEHGGDSEPTRREI